jgi:glycosyltransferase involved in cell wall biosynthesis
VSPRVLILTPFPPRLDGRHGGSRAMAGSIRALSARHEVGVLGLGLPDDRNLSPELVTSCSFVETVVRRPPRSRALQRAADAGAGLGGIPASVRAARSGAFAKRVAAVLETYRPDVVQAEHLAMGQYLDLARGAARVVVVHEPGAAAAADRLRTSTGPKRALRALDASAWRRWEPRLLATADAAITFTDHDRAALLRREPQATVRVIPLGTHIPERASSAVGEAPPGVLFVGNFMHAPNREAASCLVSEILPSARRALPGLPAVIVGPAPPPALLASADELTEVTGAVESVDPYVERAAIVVAPVWSGGGMRVKVLEALAAGKALVATSRALEGLDLRAGEHVMVADTVEAFAHAVVALAADPAARARIAAAARRWAIEHLSWESVTSEYEAAWAEAVARSSMRSAA